MIRQLPLVLTLLLATAPASAIESHECSSCRDPVRAYRDYGNTLYNHAYASNALARAAIFQGVVKGLVVNPQSGQQAFVMIRRNRTYFNLLGLAIMIPGQSLTVTVQGPDGQQRRYPLIVGTPRLLVGQQQSSAETQPKPASSASARQKRTAGSGGSSNTASSGSSGSASTMVAYDFNYASSQHRRRTSGTPIITIVECHNTCKNAVKKI